MSGHQGIRKDDRLGPVVELSRSQVRELAEALKPVIKKHGSKIATAAALDMPTDPLMRVLRQPAALWLRKRWLDIMGTAAGVDTKAWGTT